MRPAVGQPLSPAEAMRLAIREGGEGAGFVAPNPLVGCTILDRDHRFLAVGAHRKVGFDHAEVDALKKITDPAKLEGAHFYVTLEPCAHQGRTPSCARTLAPLKLGSLTYAVQDPNPLVSGKGAEILREAGVKTWLVTERDDVPEAAQLAQEAEDLAEIFLHNHRTKLPFIAVKVGTSLDGKMAMVTGESKWITGEKAREHVHVLRASYDAVLVGRNTFVADDPSLNVRHERFPAFKNRAVVLDPEGKTLASMGQSNLLKVRDPKSVFAVVGERAEVTNPFGVRLIRVRESEDGNFEVAQMLEALKAEGLTSLMVEGGAHTYGTFFNQGHVQRLHVYQAPILLGGRHGVAWSTHFGGSSIADKIHITGTRREILGEDLYWTGRVGFK